MGKDIFKDAKFGDKFYTMDGRILIYHCAKQIEIYHCTKPTENGAEIVVVNQLIEEFNSDFILCDDSGECLNMSQYGNDYDVVDRYVEKIDEEELDRLAQDYIKDKKEPSMRIASFNGFRAGYRKALNK